MVNKEKEHVTHKISVKCQLPQRSVGQRARVTENKCLVLVTIESCGPENTCQSYIRNKVLQVKDLAQIK